MSGDRACRVLVTGAGGQVGRALALQSWPKGFELAAVARDDLDIADQKEVRAAMADGAFNIVVNAAAYTAVDKAEAEPEQAFAVNARGAENLAAACAENGAALVHISTDYVFDGSKPSPYLETDPVAPLGVYGQSKLAGEEAVQNALAEHVILRTAWVYAARGRNFVRTMIALARERDELRVVSDQTGNPTSAADLAGAIVRVAAALRDGRVNSWGIYHCTNAGETTWHGLAEAVVDLAAPHLGRRPAVIPISTHDYPAPAARPKNSRLDCAKIKSAFGVEMRPWRDALADVVQEIFREEKSIAGAMTP